MVRRDPLREPAVQVVRPVEAEADQSQHHQHHQQRRAAEHDRGKVEGVHRDMKAAASRRRRADSLRRAAR